MPLEATEKPSNATEQAEQGSEQGEGLEALADKQSSGKLNSGVDAREAARLSAIVRREKAQERAREADLDKLTVRQRASVAMREGAPYQSVLSAVQAILAKAGKGDVPAFRAYMEWVEKLGPVEGDAERDAAMALLTPDQRAQVREWLIQERDTAASAKDA